MINALTCINSTTQWLEFNPTRNKTSFHVAKLFDTSWLCCYLEPRRVIFNSGWDVQGFEFQELLTSYGVTPEPIAVKKAQANSIIKNVYLTMGNMLHTKYFSLDDRDMWWE